MRRAWLVAAVAAAALGPAAGEALGLAEVSFNADTHALDVTVVGVAAADGNHGFAIRPGIDTVRVEQLAFGDPRSRARTSTCSRTGAATRST